MYKRNNTKVIHIGNIAIGGGNPIAIQSMCNTKTNDIDATVNQILELENAGCDIIRVSVPDEESAKAINKIKNKIHIPIVADIHFDYRLAIIAADNGADKIRINPGNIGDEENIKKVADHLKNKNIPIRIGVNAGSLSKKILDKYNNIITPEGLYESAKENILLLEKYDFNNIIVSIKSSDLITCINAYKLFADNYDYPLHLGITEAGNLNMGVVKSSIGIGNMLIDGIGDTIRVSLTSDPINEVRAGFNILKSLKLRKGIEIVSCPTCARTNINIEKITNQIENEIYKNKLLYNKNIKLAIMGCSVNGPGEARDADIGICGGIGEALIIKKGEIIDKIPEDQIINKLMEEIKNI